MFQTCPKCGHAPLPENQALPAECPACGVILAKVAAAREARAVVVAEDDESGVMAPASSRWLHVDDEVDERAWWGRVAVLAVFAAWGWRLVAMDYRDGEICGSFIHLPLLVFHEAGHVVFRPFGEWVTMLGGTLGQLIMPGLLCGALLLKNRDPFGAALGLWLFGVSILDVSTYMYDAMHPQLMLLTGQTGDLGPHDWVYLFGSMQLLFHAQGIGAFTHALGALVVLLAVGWAASVLRLQRRRIGRPG